MSTGPLTELMRNVDQLDNELAALLVRRFHHSRLIGAVKREAGEARFDPLRVNSQRSRFIELCVAAGLDAKMAEALIVTITDRVIAERYEPE